MATASHPWNFSSSPSFLPWCPPPPPPSLLPLAFLALKPKAPITRLRVGVSSRAFPTTSRHHHPLISACLKSSANSVPCPESDPSLDEGVADTSSPSTKANFDIKLPRRNLIVQFTCNACGERTQRIINRMAYERGTVFVQCAGCLVNHKLVDNLGLVVEYDLTEDIDTDSDVVNRVDT